MSRVFNLSKYNTLVGNDLSLNEKLQVSNDVSLNANVDVTSKLNVHGNAYLNSGLFVGGDLSWNSNNIPNQSIPAAALIGGTGAWTSSGSDVYYNNGNVGIGTSSPSALLDINGSIRGGYDSNTTSYFGRTAIGATSTYGDQAYFSHIDKTSAGEYALIQNSSGSTLINAADGQNIWFRVNNNTKMILNSDGNVGIGTTSPMSKLEVNGAASFTGTNAAFNSTDTVGIHLGTSGTQYPMMQIVSSNATGGWIDFAFTDSINSSTSYDDRHGRIRYGYTNGFTFDTAATERMRISSNGNVGIGTTSPGAKLDVNGSMRAAYNSNTASYFGRAAIGYVGHSDWAGFAHLDKNNTSSYALIQNSSGQTRINAANGQDLYLMVNNSTKMTLKSNSRVGIGTTNPGNALLEVSGYVTKSNFHSRYLNLGGANGTITMTRNISIYCNHKMSCEELLIHSDRRIKTNIVDVPDNLALEMLRNIPCKYYNYKDILHRGEQTTIGFIAQEVKEVFPMAVETGPDIIPDEYRMLDNFTWEEINDNKYNLHCDLQDCSGVTYRFIVTNDLDDENDEESIDIVGNEDNTFTFEKQYSHVFVYGKQVEDFNSLNKSKLFTVAFSALQEVDRQQQADKANIASLETQVSTLESENATLKTQIADILQRLTNANI